MATNKPNLTQAAEKVLVVFLTTFAVSFAATPEPVGWKLLGAAVAALTTAINEVLPIGPVSTLIDAVLAALGRVVPSAAVKLDERKAARKQK